MCGGLSHTVVAALSRQEIWKQILDEGFFNTVTLTPSADRLAVAEAYWFSAGSFGVPLLLLGSLVTWLIRRGARVPWWLGGGVAAWAVLLGLLGGFDSGSIALLLIGGLLAAGSLRNFSGNTRARA
jgi:anti-sigma factor RsiW